MKTGNKLRGRDLINIGIYGAIYFVILFVVAIPGMIPIFLPLLSVLIPILGGIPFMLFLTKRDHKRYETIRRRKSKQRCGRKEFFSTLDVFRKRNII